MKKCIYVFACGHVVPSDQAEYLKVGQITKLKRQKGVTRDISNNSLFCHECLAPIAYKISECAKCGEQFRDQTQNMRRKYCDTCKAPKSHDGKPHNAQCPMCEKTFYSETWYTGEKLLREHCPGCRKYVRRVERCYGHFSFGLPDTPVTVESELDVDPVFDVAAYFDDHRLPHNITSWSGHPPAGKWENGAKRCWRMI